MNRSLSNNDNVCASTREIHLRTRLTYTRSSFTRSYVYRCIARSKNLWQIIFFAPHCSTFFFAFVLASSYLRANRISYRTNAKNETIFIPTNAISTDTTIPRNASLLSDSFESLAVENGKEEGKRRRRKYSAEMSISSLFLRVQRRSLPRE